MIPERTVQSIERHDNILLVPSPWRSAPAHSFAEAAGEFGEPGADECGDFEEDR